MKLGCVRMSPSSLDVPSCCLNTRDVWCAPSLRKAQFTSQTLATHKGDENRPLQSEQLALRMIEAISIKTNSFCCDITERTLSTSLSEGISLSHHLPDGGDPPFSGGKQSGAPFRGAPGYHLSHHMPLNIRNGY